VSTVILKNRLTKNLLDLSNATSNCGSLVDQGGNIFDTGGVEAEPVVRVSGAWRLPVRSAASRARERSEARGTSQRVGSSNRRSARAPAATIRDFTPPSDRASPGPP